MLLLIIEGYFTLCYYWLLKGISPYVIIEYFKLYYHRLFVVILLVIIVGYFIDGYWCLFY